MRRIASALLLLCLLAARAPGQSPEQLFQQGNMQYQQGKLAEARQIYEGLLVRGYVSGELYYNLGNAYYKSGDVARAILSFERALKLMPNDDDLRHNLQLANLMITDKIEPTPRLFIWDYWDSIKQSMSLQGMTWLMYVFFVLTIGSIVVVVLSRTYRARRLAFTYGAANGLIFLFLLVVLGSRVSDLSARDRAIVTAGITTVKNSPDPKSSDAFVLHGGVKVQITDLLSGWIKIRLADGKVGWMESTAAEVI